MKNNKFLSIILIFFSFILFGCESNPSQPTSTDTSSLNLKSINEEDYNTECNETLSSLTEFLTNNTNVDQLDISKSIGYDNLISFNSKAYALEGLSNKSKLTTQISTSISENKYHINVIQLVIDLEEKEIQDKSQINKLFNILFPNEVNSNSFEYYYDKFQNSGQSEIVLNDGTLNFVYNENVSAQSYKNRLFITYTKKFILEGYDYSKSNICTLKSSKIKRQQKSALKSLIALGKENNYYNEPTENANETIYTFKVPHSSDSSLNSTYSYIFTESSNADVPSNYIIRYEETQESFNELNLNNTLLDHFLNLDLIDKDEFNNNLLKFKQITSTESSNIISNYSMSYLTKENKLVTFKLLRATSGEVNFTISVETSFN